MWRPLKQYIENIFKSYNIRVHDNKSTKFNDIRTLNVQKEIQNIEKEKENYLRTPSSINNTTISSSRVHVIGKPKKALIVNKTIINSQDSSQNNCNNNNHYRKPSPPQPHPVV